MSSGGLRLLFDGGAGAARGRVDPGGVRGSLRERRAAHEALGISGEGSGERLIADRHRIAFLRSWAKLAARFRLRAATQAMRSPRPARDSKANLRRAPSASPPVDQQAREVDPEFARQGWPAASAWRTNAASPETGATALALLDDPPPRATSAAAVGCNSAVAGSNPASVQAFATLGQRRPATGPPGQVSPVSPTALCGTAIARRMASRNRSASALPCPCRFATTLRPRHGAAAAHIRRPEIGPAVALPAR